MVHRRTETIDASTASHAIIERAVGEWRQRLRLAFVLQPAGGGHFQHML